MSMDLADDKSTLVQVKAYHMALMNVNGLCWWQVNIGSGNGLVPSGNKPLPELMFTQIYVAILCNQATMS